MAINFTDNPSNGATQTISGRTYTYNSAKNKWDTTATEVTGPTAAVYASVDNLPTSGNITGSQAFVSGTNRLYIWNGTGWYNIALINTTPSISGVSATYDLATDGTATTVTITASDPEGLPITYSIASDTSGNTATVTQGTGSNTNVFTITPSTNTAHGGTFSLTFRASDGVNLATAVSSFTLQFIVENQRYTTALITSVGANNATNASFDDKSTSDHTITANGDIHQTTFSPYRHGGNAVSFPGNNNASYGYLTLDNAIVPETGPWTFEAWIRVNSSSSRQTLISWYQNSVTGRGYVQVRDNADTGREGCVTIISIGSSTLSLTGTTRVDDGAWHHVVAERDGNVWSIWIDGTRDAQTTLSVPCYTGINTRIGHSYNTASPWYPMGGLMRDVRFSTSARYQGAATITVPSEDQTTTTGYALLCCQSFDPFTDKTGNRTITVNNSSSIFVEQVGAGPYDAQEYSAASNGGSLSNDGTGTNYLSVTSSDFEFGTSDDFVIEAWVYPKETPSNAAQVIDNRGAANGFNLAFTSANKFFNQSEPLSQQFESTAKTLNQWYHVAVVRYNGTRRLFVNGVSEGSVADTGNYNSNTAVITSRHSQDQQALNGNVSDLRIIRGTIPSAYQGTSLTVPTAPLTAVTDTKLLVQSTDAGIIDKSQTANFVALNGGTKSSTGYTKYLSSSMYFDGVDDTITVPQIDIKAGEDFTIECWHYLTSRTDSYPALFGNYSTWGTGGLGLFADHSSYSGGYQVAHNGTFPFLNIGTVTYNQWVHVALVRNGTTMTLYVDGTSAGSGTSGSVALPGVGTSFMIGRSSDNADGHIQGYLSDFRITQGLARYTSNFTAPTAALQG